MSEDAFATAIVPVAIAVACFSGVSLLIRLLILQLLVLMMLFIVVQLVLAAGIS